MHIVFIKRMKQCTVWVIFNEATFLFHSSFVLHSKYGQNEFLQIVVIMCFVGLWNRIRFFLKMISPIHNSLSWKMSIMKLSILYIIIFWMNSWRIYKRLLNNIKYWIQWYFIRLKAHFTDSDSVKLQYNEICQSCFLYKLMNNFYYIFSASVPSNKITASWKTTEKNTKRVWLRVCQKCTN